MSFWICDSLGVLSSFLFMPTPLPAPVRELKQAVKDLETSVIRLKRAIAKDKDAKESRRIQRRIKKSA